MSSRTELSLLARERIRAQVSPSTSADFELVSQMIEFPRRVSGLYILDVGAGASLAAKTLRERGARVFAIDPRYENLQELNRSIEQYLQDPTISSTRQERERTQMMLQLNPAVQRRQMEFIRRLRSNKNNFFQEQRIHKKTYIPALAGYLPFRDILFDFIFSDQCLSTTLLEDIEVFLQAFSEAMRVLKEGRELQMHPWFNGQGAWGRNQALNASIFLTYLEKRGIKYSIESTGPTKHMRLRVIKPQKNS